MINKKMKKEYYIGLGVFLNPNHPPPPYFGRRWKILFKNIMGKKQGAFFTLQERKSIPSKNIIIEASSFKKAVDIAQLIYACLVVLKAGDYFGFEPEITLKEINKDFKPTNLDTLYTDSLDLASFMAAKASFNLNLVYAIHKLAISFHLGFISCVDLDPYLNSDYLEKPTLKKYFPVKNLVTMSCMITMAYAAIEELNLHTRASSNLKEWGEKHENDLLKRFKEEKLDPNELYDWILRGPKTFLERNMSDFNKMKKAEWSRGPIRDVKVKITEAIYFSSFLRNKVSAHTLNSPENKKRIKTLSMYDVTNGQYLARRLILEKLKLWTLLTNPNKTRQE